MKRTLSCLTVTLLLILCAPARAAMVTGAWEFNGDYSAAIGTDLVPQGGAVAGTVFGTTTALGVPDIGGLVAQVMRFPAMPTSIDGYVMYPGAAANGSTGDVNQYTLIMDILYPSASTGFRALFQTRHDNVDDADWFVNGGNGIGIKAQYNGALTPDTWHRIALVVDLEQTDVTKKYLNYIDGAFVGYSDLDTQGNPGGRFSVWTASSGNPSWVFSDDSGETALGYVNSVQFRDYAMTPTEIANLGGASAAGIPAAVRPLNDTGMSQCLNSAGTAYEACSAANAGDFTPYPRQDGRFGRDAAANLGQLVKTGGGAAGFDFTPLDASGNVIALTSGIPSATPVCVRDNVTNLIWEVKTDDNGLRDKDWTYTWYNGASGTPDGGDNCSNTARCDTDKYVADVNTASLCGYNTGWRMPTRRELLSIVHRGVLNPAIDSNFFPNTPFTNPTGVFWTSDWNLAGNPYYVYFTDGNPSPGPSSTAYAVRAVRAAP